MALTLDRRVADDQAALAAFHDERLRYLLGLPDEAQRGEAATRYITWLDEARADATAIRYVAVYKLHNEQRLGAMRIAALFGVARARGQQLIYKVAEKYPGAVQRVAKIKRRLGKS